MRLAQCAIAAARLGMTVGLDAQQPVLTLLSEALDRTPTAPDRDAQ